MKRIIVLCLISVFVFSGCALFKSKEEESAQDLAWNGTDEFNSGNYKSALASFEKLKDWYPFSKYAILADLKIADAQFQLEAYTEAIEAYEEFENLHPRNEAIPYVVYQMGLCYFRQIDAIDRDQTPALKALDVFRRLKSQFPTSSYATTAEEHITKCLKSLAGQEFYVGLFYFKGKHYKAALNRFKGVLTNYPDVGVHQKALQYVALCEASIQEKKMSEESDKKN
jgi:outer membrane protein assembly factor BamD